MAAEKSFTEGNDRNMNAGRGERGSSIPNDLPDNRKDEEKLQPEETFIDLPDVKDIPGQEFVHTAPLGELADTTIASDDEEGRGVFDLDDSEDFTPGNDGDVRADERQALRDTNYMPTRDEDNLRQARMDNVDFDGDPLNERSFGEGQELSGADLDTGDMPDETRTDAMGQGDEENKMYSVDDTDREEPGENRSGA
jgi:hypothetical protein